MLTHGSGGERVTVTRGVVRCREFPVVVITSNGERDFPPAFMRRCVRLDLPDPDEARLRTSSPRISVRTRCPTWTTCCTPSSTAGHRANSPPTSCSTPCSAQGRSRSGRRRAAGRRTPPPGRMGSKRARATATGGTRVTPVANPAARTSRCPADPAPVEKLGRRAGHELSIHELLDTLWLATAASPGATAPLASALTAERWRRHPAPARETPSAPRPAPPRPSSTPPRPPRRPAAASRPAAGRAARGGGGAQRTRVRGPRRAGAAWRARRGRAARTGPRGEGARVGPTAPQPCAPAAQTAPAGAVEAGVRRGGDGGGHGRDGTARCGDPPRPAALARHPPCSSTTASRCCCGGGWRWNCAPCWNASAPSATSVCTAWTPGRRGHRCCAPAPSTDTRRCSPPRRSPTPRAARWCW